MKAIRDFALQTIPGGTFGCDNCSGHATGTSWAEVRDAAQHPTIPTTACPPHGAIYLAQNVSNTKVEKPCDNCSFCSFQLLLGI